MIVIGTISVICNLLLAEQPTIVHVLKIDRGDKLEFCLFFCPITLHAYLFVSDLKSLTISLLMKRLKMTKVVCSSLFMSNEKPNSPVKGSTMGKSSRFFVHSYIVLAFNNF